MGFMISSMLVNLLAQGMLAAKAVAVSPPSPVPGIIRLSSSGCTHQAALVSDLQSAISDLCHPSRPFQGATLPSPLQSCKVIHMYAYIYTV